MKLSKYILILAHTLLLEVRFGSICHNETVPAPITFQGMGVCSAHNIHYSTLVHIYLLQPATATSGNDDLYMY